MGLLEDLLQLLQLVTGEGGAVPPLFALVALRVGLVHGAGEVRAGPVLGHFHPGLLHAEVAAVHSRRVGARLQVGLSQIALLTYLGGRGEEGRFEQGEGGRGREENRCKSFDRFIGSTN